MSKYLITYRYETGEMDDAVTDLHPADWLLREKEYGNQPKVIVFTLLITDQQYEKLRELGY